MSQVSIPFGLDPHGTEVPISEAIRGKLDYYQCPKCNNPLTPRMGEQRRYFAHKRGAVKDGECPLSSQRDVDQMVDNLRTSDIEKQESARQIRTYIGEEPGGRLRLFGVIPSTEWEQFGVAADVDALLQECSISTEGVIHPPTGRSFHPSEPEVSFELDPSATEFRVSIDGSDQLENIVGDWSTDEVSASDIFVGDQTRARRSNSKRQIKLGEWVYAVTDGDVDTLDDEMSLHTLGDWEILAFPAREDTTKLLEQYGADLRTDKYGFEADVILPAEAHPTADKPIESPPGSTVLIGVTPAEEQDPIFEIVSIPKRKGDTVELDPTGPGNTRFYRTKVPQQGSKRVSVHQRNSSRHRLIHLHAVEAEDKQPLAESMYGDLGLTIDHDDQSVLLSPTGETRSVTIESSVTPATLPDMIDYVGPDGIDLELKAHFPPDHPEAPSFTRSTTDIESDLSNMGHWVMQGCTAIDVTFEGIGSVSIAFGEETSKGVSP